MRNNLVIRRFVGDGKWYPLNATHLVCSGNLFAGTTINLRLDGGPSILVPTNIALPFRNLDLSRLEFMGATSMNILSIVAFSRSE